MNIQNIKKLIIESNILLGNIIVPTLIKATLLQFRGLKAYNIWFKCLK